MVRVQLPGEKFDIARANFVTTSTILKIKLPCFYTWNTFFLKKFMMQVCPDDIRLDILFAVS